MSDLQRHLAEEMKDPEFAAAYQRAKEKALEAEAERLYNERFRAPFGTQPWDQVGDHVKTVYREAAARLALDREEAGGSA